MSFENKCAVITGGSRGIGKEIAKAVLIEGAKIVIASRTVSELDSTICELKQHNTNNIIGVVSDISFEPQIRNLFKKTQETYGNIDILINAAGIQSPIGALEEIDAQGWIENININLIGTMLCCKFVLPYMIQKKGGKIINLSGGGATSPREYFSAYACSKTAIVRFTETLAEEVKKYNIDVNAIAPGIVNTRMMNEAIESLDRAGRKDLSDSLKDKKYSSTPDLAVALTKFLASEASDGISGKLISAVWDPWQEVQFQDKLRKDKDFGTLRRIDDMSFFKKN